jgi:OMF family outer membrane factor
MANRNIDLLFVLLVPTLLTAGGAARAESLAPAATSSSSTAALPIAFSTSSEIATSSAPPKYTWDLDDVIRIALNSNPDLQSAQDNFEAAKRVLQESYSDYLPTLDGSVFKEHTTLPSPSAGSTPLLGLDRSYSAGVATMRQTLFDFGKGLEDIRAKRAESRSSEEDLLALRNIIQLSAEKAFYDVAADEKLVEVANKSFDQFQETYRRTKLMVQTGTRPEFDLSQALVELSKAELAVINAKNARDLAKIVLLNIMGWQKVETFALKEPVGQSESMRAENLSMDMLTDKAMEFRPEMRRANLLIEASLDRLKEQQRTYLPTIAASGWYGRFLPDYPDAIRGAWGYGVGASWNLFDGMATTFRVKELEARLDQEEALAKRQHLSIVAEVASAYMNLLRAEQNQTVADAGLVYAKENFHYAQLRYGADVGTILELLVAETSLVTADAVQVQAHYRYATSLAALQTAVNAPLSLGQK